MEPLLDPYNDRYLLSFPFLLSLITIIISYIMFRVCQDVEAPPVLPLSTELMFPTAGKSYIITHLVLDILH